VFSGPAYDFDNPSAVTTDGTDVWVTNRLNNTVTELNAATGALVQVIS
jgi:DNA-binding beta-propeller fold protein YncE